MPLKHQIKSNLAEKKFKCLKRNVLRGKNVAQFFKGLSKNVQNRFFPLASEVGEK